MISKCNSRLLPQGSKINLKSSLCMGQVALTFCLPSASLSLLLFEWSSWHFNCLIPCPSGKWEWKVPCQEEKSTSPRQMDVNFFKHCLYTCMCSGGQKKFMGVVLVRVQLWTGKIHQKKLVQERKVLSQNIKLFAAKYLLSPGRYLTLNIIIMIIYWVPFLDISLFLHLLLKLFLILFLLSGLCTPGLLWTWKKKSWSLKNTIYWPVQWPWPIQTSCSAVQRANH